MTDSGNFYCLKPAGENRWRRSVIQKMSPERRRMWAISRAKCNELAKSPLSGIKGLSETIIKNLRTSPEPIHNVNQEEMAL